MPMVTQVLGRIDLRGKVVTAGALHTVKATAEFICDHGGEFVLPVKKNRKALSTPSTRCPGSRSRSPTSRPTGATAGSPDPGQGS